MIKDKPENYFNFSMEWTGISDLHIVYIYLYLMSRAKMTVYIMSQKIFNDILFFYWKTH